MTLTPSTRASLLLRLRDSQDHEAWVEFVTIYEPVTYRLLRHHGLQDTDAREVMQELFLAVSRSIDRRRFGGDGLGQNSSEQIVGMNHLGVEQASNCACACTVVGRVKAGAKRLRVGKDRELAQSILAAAHALVMTQDRAGQ